MPGKYILSESIKLPAGASPLPIIRTPEAGVVDAETRLRQVVFHLLTTRERVDGIVHGKAAWSRRILDAATRLQKDVVRAQQEAYGTTEFVMRLKGKVGFAPEGIRVAMSRIQQLEGKTRGIQNALRMLSETIQRERAARISEIGLR